MSGTPPHNPYAPPADFGILPVPPVPPGASGGPQPWDVEEVIKAAWAAFKLQWVVLVLAVFLPGMLVSFPMGAPDVLSALKVVEAYSLEYLGVLGFCWLVAMVIGTFFHVGSLRIFLAAARGRQAELGALFGGADRFFPLVGVILLQSLAIVTGLLLLIVPGIILALGFGLAPYYCVDARMGPVQSLRASWDATNGQKGKIFVFFLACTVVLVAGYLACCVGAYPASAVTWVAFSIVYVRLSGRIAPA